ncbi:glutathione S-transferase class-mu 26 kDa isozyme 7-like isoform X2 [Paramacrobiotus metropolitanus]|uniref:glutathione S-transferase class-mu 26 kDa isozyme 7-like isoform X2 n=1 Tax=Paramacrobiotus metropolitanus TaxID=2943436 RepID=UPI002445C85A|nr:glutathione S-transferase class-mu 26 kDa isozyme 7-like isoform X2 [Paramacrobiotus metropolitanus]
MLEKEYEWKEFDCKEFHDKKEKDPTLDVPNLPYYADGDLKITHSIAIIRYLGRKHGLVAKNDKDTIEQDMMDGMTFNLIVNWGWMGYGEQDKLSFDMEFQKIMLQELEDHLKNRQYCVGTYLTYSDFCIFERLDAIQIRFPGIFDSYPNLKQFHESIENLKGIKEFRNSSRFIRVLNEPMAKWNNT